MGEIADTLIRGYQLGAQDDEEAFEMGFWDDGGPDEDDRFMLLEDGREEPVYFGETALECWSFAIAIDEGAVILADDDRPMLAAGWQIVPIPEDPAQEGAAA